VKQRLMISARPSFAGVAKEHFHQYQNMKTLFAVTVLAGLCCCGCTSAIHAGDDFADQPNNQQLCEWMISAHRMALESVFESELYAISYPDGWHLALKALAVATTDLEGHPLRSSFVLESTIDGVVHVKNPADRERLEYVLLGSALSLADRRRFDAYCSVAAP